MSPTKPGIEEVSGYLGVGSLLLLGAFLIADGLTGFYLLVAHYAKEPAFAILFAVPLLVISYVLGLFSCLAAELVVKRFALPRLDSRLFAAVVRSDKAALLARYLEAERHSRLLYGCTFAFLLLGVGSLVVRPRMSGFDSVGTACFVIGILLAALCPLLARTIQHNVAGEIECAMAAERDDA